MRPPSHTATCGSSAESKGGCQRPPNQTLHLTGAAILVSCDITLLQAAPAGELWRSAAGGDPVAQLKAAVPISDEVTNALPMQSIPE